METITKNYQVYDFSELSETAKEKVVNDFSNDSFYAGWIFDEAGQTLKEFCSIFSINYRNIDFLEPYRNEYSFGLEDNILGLSGLRLRTYIINNYYSNLYKKRYLKDGGLSDTKPNSHKMREISQIQANCPNKGKYSISYYSNIQLDNDCPLTGTIYDYSILDPIYNFLNKPKDSITFEDLLNDCISNLSKDVQKEYEYQLTQAAIEDYCLANNYKFLENGEMFNN